MSKAKKTWKPKLRDEMVLSKPSNKDSRKSGPDVKNKNPVDKEKKDAA